MIDINEFNSNKVSEEFLEKCKKARSIFNIEEENVMSLDKAIEHKKEHRKPYRGAQAVDKSCRCHGGGTRWQCEYCKSNRLHKFRDKHPRKDEDYIEEECIES